MAALLESLYAASADEGAWPAFFSGLKQATGAAHAGLFACDLVSGASALTGPLEPWIPQPDLMAFALPAGSLIRGENLAGTLPCYLAVHLGLQDGRLSYLALASPVVDGVFKASAAWVLERLAPHARRVLEVRRQMAHARRWSSALDQTLGAVWMVTKDAQTLAATQTAERWATERKGLGTDRGGRLAGPDTTSTQSLRQALASVGPHQPVQVVPLPDGCLASLALLDSGTVGVAAICPESLARGTELLGTAYGLTPAERRLLQALMDEGNVSAAARILGVTRDTAKTQMTSIFARTRTSGQAELVRLVCAIGLLARPGSF